MVVIVIGAIIKTTQKISRVGFAKWWAGDKWDGKG
jgi:hypothetical protein